MEQIGQEHATNMSYKRIIQLVIVSYGGLMISGRSLAGLHLSVTSLSSSDHQNTWSHVEISLNKSMRSCSLCAHLLHLVTLSQHLCCISQKPCEKQFVGYSMLYCIINKYKARNNLKKRNGCELIH